MCQKALGGFFGPFVTAFDLDWTRGAPAWFASSDKVRRGFCAACGTPLAYDVGGRLEITIGSLDEPERAPPTIQINLTDRLGFFEELNALPVLTPEQIPEHESFKASLCSFQHPDHDTAVWPPAEPK